MHAGDTSPDGMQRLPDPAGAGWSMRPAIWKQGSSTVGTQRKHTRMAGLIENGQVVVCPTYLLMSDPPCFPLAAVFSVRLNAARGEQSGVQRVEHGGVEVLDPTVPDVGADVITEIVPVVRVHALLHRMLAAGQPLLDELLDCSPALAHEPTLLVVDHRLPARGPCLAFGGEGTLGDLPTLAGQRVGVSVKEVALGLSSLLNVAFHAASKRSRSRSRTTKM